MTLKSKMTSLAAATALAVGSLTPLAATSAQAGGYYNGGHAGIHQVRSRHGKRHFRHGRRHNRHFNRHHNQHRYYYKKKRNRTGKYIALGFGALMLGIIASQASRNHHNSYYDYDY